MGPTSGMLPPGMRMTTHMNPNLSKPQHAAVGAVGGIGVGPNTGGNMMSDWNNPRFNQVNNPNAMRSPNPNQIMQQQNPMQGNPVRNFNFKMRKLISNRPNYSNRY